MEQQVPILHGYIGSPFAQKAVLMLNLKVRLATVSYTYFGT